MPNIFIAMFFVIALFAYLTSLMIVFIMIASEMQETNQLRGLRREVGVLCDAFEAANTK